jgi:hypothetical protein
MMKTDTAITYKFTLSYAYLIIYFSAICGLTTLFLETSNYIAPSTNVEEEAQEEVEEGEIVEETTRSSLTETQENSDEEIDNLSELPTYNDSIYNTIDYSESEKET